MKTYTIYQSTTNDLWYLIDSASERVLQYTYFDDLMQHLAEKESEKLS